MYIREFIFVQQLKVDFFSACENDIRKLFSVAWRMESLMYSPVANNVDGFFWKHCWRRRYCSNYENFYGRQGKYVEQKSLFHFIKGSRGYLLNVWKVLTARLKHATQTLKCNPQIPNDIYQTIYHSQIYQTNCLKLYIHHIYQTIYILIYIKPYISSNLSNSQMYVPNHI